jgi:quinoprotein dehydrogenase-associated probable ABC transporter substrate-binding protein
MRTAALAALRSAAAAIAALVCLTDGQAAELNRADLVNRQSLRVCSDPANLPFSNEAQAGFENKIADLVAEELKVPVEYTWFPQATGFVRQTLFARRCDIIMGFAQGDDLVLNTNAYYRSSYVLVTRPDSPLAGATGLDDPRLQGKQIGVMAGTPPATTMLRVGLMPTAKPYPLMVDRRYDAPAEQMIADIRSGVIDAGVLWGPIGGSLAKSASPALAVIPLKDGPGARMSFRITFGIRNQEGDWKHRLNEVIAKRQGDIDDILLTYGVPLLDDQSQPITAPRR